MVMRKEFSRFLKCSTDLFIFQWFTTSFKKGKKRHKLKNIYIYLRIHYIFFSHTYLGIGHVIQSN